MITILLLIVIFLIGYWRGYVDAYDKGMDDMEKIALMDMHDLDKELRNHYETKRSKNKDKA